MVIIIVGERLCMISFSNDARWRYSHLKSGGGGGRIIGYDSLMNETGK